MAASGFWTRFTNRHCVPIWYLFFTYYFVQVTQRDTQNKKVAKPRCIKGITEKNKLKKLLKPPNASHTSPKE